MHLIPVKLDNEYVSWLEQAGVWERERETCVWVPVPELPCFLMLSFVVKESYHIYVWASLDIAQLHDDFRMNCMEKLKRVPRA